MTIVFKLSNNIKKDVINFYSDFLRDKTPPYAVFQAKCEDTIITLYESGKLMFQGPNADIDARLWKEMEKKKNHLNIDITDSSSKKDKDKKEENSEKKKYTYKSTIGSDEVGTGDVFGPIIVTSSFIHKDDIAYLKELGVTDSKKLTDDKILKIAPILMKKVSYDSACLDNKTYNEKHSSTFNMNKMKAILHDKVLKKTLSKNSNYDYIIIDQFVNKKKYYEYLNGFNPLFGITFLTKAEDYVVSVAVSSIISRYLFLKEIDKISKDVGFEILKGANDKVYNQVKVIYEKYGKEKLTKICKMNFKGIDETINSQ
ncbi:MAG: ribonuclease HIII [Bacilli bacterium]